VSPTSLSFGSIDIGQDVSKTFTIASAGTEPVTVRVPDGGVSAFSWNAVGATTLVPGASFPVTVEFSPKAAGRYTDSVSIISDAPGDPHVSLEGSCRPGTPQ
jgi:hypothetical protein